MATTRISEESKKMINAISKQRKKDKRLDWKSESILEPLIKKLHKKECGDEK